MNDCETELVCACAPWWLCAGLINLTKLKKKKNLKVAVTNLPLRLSPDSVVSALPGQSRLQMWDTLIYLPAAPGPRPLRGCFSWSCDSAQEPFSPRSPNNTHLSKHRHNFLWPWQKPDFLVCLHLTSRYFMLSGSFWSDQQPTGFHLHKFAQSLVFWQTKRWFITETGTWVCVSNRGTILLNPSLLPC